MFARLMGLKSISPEKLHRLAQGPDPITVIDVNPRRSWADARVPGARLLDPAEYMDSDLPPDKNAMLVFYCSYPMCRKAPRAGRRARKFGYNNVHVMSAGISGWQNANLPIESGE